MGYPTTTTAEPTAELAPVETSTLTIQGASDDLIEVRGDVDEEFNVYPDPDLGLFVGCSDGTLIQANFTNSGIWRLVVLAKGPNTKVDLDQMPATDGDEDDRNSDIVTLTGSKIRWVTCGTHMVTAKK